MDINVQGVRSAGAVDIKPAAERKTQRPDLAGADFDERESVSVRNINATSLADGAGVIGVINDAVVSLQEFAQSIQRDLSFRVDDSSGRVVVEVRDQSSGEVIRQIPSEEALQLLKHLEEARSLMVNTTA
ncbi:flagellar protein FlaG [Pseudomonas sp. NPDC077649]|uniref:flagellar protein FlaG n=1 Tax=Pseudomonas sp. NPDC077649 TaxID=3364423 RepID=UPI0037C555B1